MRYGMEKITICSEQYCAFLLRMLKKSRIRSTLKLSPTDINPIVT